MKKKLLDYIPKKYKNAVQEFYKDSRGYWLILNDGYILEDYYGAHVIHEDNYKRHFKSPASMCYKGVLKC